MDILLKGPHPWYSFVLYRTLCLFPECTNPELHVSRLRQYPECYYPDQVPLVWAPGYTLWEWVDLQEQDQAHLGNRRLGYRRGQGCIIQETCIRY